MPDDCPSCGEEIKMAAIAGPGKAIVAPCFCNVHPEQLRSEEEPDV